MSYLQEQSYQLILISACSLILRSIARGEKGKRIITMLSGIFLIVFVLNALSPLVSFVKENDFSAGNTDDEIVSDTYADAFIQATASEICRSVKLLIINRFSLNEADFSVTVTLNTDDIEAIRPTLITVTMNVESDSALSLLIAEYVSDTLATPTVIIEK